MFYASIPVQKKRRLGSQFLGGGGPPPFAPTDIAGLQLWLDFSDITTLFTDSAGTTPVTADGDVIGKANDKSGVGNHVIQATTGNKFTYKTNIQNSLSAAYSDGSGDWLENTISGISLSALTIFVAVRIASGADNDIQFFHFSNNTVNSGIGFLIPGTDANRRFRAYTTAGEAIHIDNLAWKSANSILLTGLWNRPEIDLYHNAALSSATPTDRDGDISVTITHVNLRGAGRTDYVLHGYLHEIIAYNGALSLANRTLVHNYINTKWAIY